MSSYTYKTIISVLFVGSIVLAIVGGTMRFIYDGSGCGTDQACLDNASKQTKVGNTLLWVSLGSFVSFVLIVAYVEQKKINDFRKKSKVFAQKDQELEKELESYYSNDLYKH